MTFSLISLLEAETNFTAETPSQKKYPVHKIWGVRRMQTGGVVKWGGGISGRELAGCKLGHFIMGLHYGRKVIDKKIFSDIFGVKCVKK